MLVLVHAVHGYPHVAACRMMGDGHGAARRTGAGASTGPHRAAPGRAGPRWAAWPQPWSRMGPVPPPKKKKTGPGKKTVFKEVGSKK